MPRATYIQRAGCDATCRFEVTTYVRTYLLHTEVQSYTTHVRRERRRRRRQRRRRRRLRAYHDDDDNEGDDDDCVRTHVRTYVRTYILRTYTIAARTYVRTYAQEARTSKKPGPLGSPGTQGGISCIFAAVVDFCTARHHGEGIGQRHALRESQQGLYQMR